MQCNFEKLNLLLDDQLNSEQKQEVRQHIKTCKKCSYDFAFLKKYKQHASKVSCETIPQHIHDSVVRSLDKKTLSIGRIAAAAAAFIIIAAGIVLFSWQINNPNSNFELGADMQYDKVAEAVPPAAVEEPVAPEEAPVEQEALFTPQPSLTPEDSPSPSENTDDGHTHSGDDDPICCR